MINKDENKLSIVGLEIPNGDLVMGTKIKLSDGSYLSHIKSIKLEASVDNPIWQITLGITPHFDNQQTIQAIIKELELDNHEASATTNQTTDNQSQAQE